MSPAVMTKNRRKPIALVTGAAGFVGSSLIDRLIHDGWHVIGLARGGNALTRVMTALQLVRGDFLETDRFSDSLQVISTDVQDPQLGLREDEWETLATQVETIWHCAANFGVNRSGDTPFSVNVAGTRHLLRFATRCNRERPAPFYYISTAFAADCHDGVAREKPPTLGFPGQNDYESSKREAEQLVLDWMSRSRSPGAIFRPSIILGHARTGRASGFAAYYDCLRSLSVVAQAQHSGRLSAPLRVVANPELRINFVTIDFVIDAMCALASASRGSDSIFHIVNDAPATLRDIVTAMCRSLGISGIELVDPSAFENAPMTRYERLFHAMIAFERPYLERQVHFDNQRFRRFVPAHLLPAPRITPALLDRINRGYHDHRERQRLEAKTRSAPAWNTEVALVNAP